MTALRAERDELQASLKTLTAQGARMQLSMCGAAGEKKRLCVPRASWRRPPSTIKVKIIKGQGIPVCEAYLQRLNQSVFHELPSCGIPENNQVPGFERLHRVPLTASQVNELYVRAFNLAHPTSADSELRKPPVDMPGVAAVWWSRGQWGDKVASVADWQKISVWRFDPQVDIDNDGKADSVVLWRNFPPRWIAGAAIDECGVAIDAYHGTGLIDKVPFILAPDNSDINVSKSETVFGAPSRVIPKGLEPYQAIRPLGGAIDIFKYRDTYYFDTTEGPNVLTAQNTIYVYRNEAGHTHQVCAYQNLSNEWNL